MDILTHLLSFILHIDVHLASVVQEHGAWVYLLLFLIVFAETAFIVLPFLPGDSLLFIVGAMCGLGLMDLPLAAGLLSAAAILGDQTNYTIGRYVGPKVWHWEGSRFFNKQHFQQAHEFYERWGGVTIVVARFMPFIRTFAPFVAGVAEMSRHKFTLYNVAGGLLWVLSLTIAGHLFGNFPLVKNNLSLIIVALIVVPGLVAIVGAWRARRRPAIA